MLLQVVLPVETRLKRGKWACFGCSPFTGDKAAAQFPLFYRPVLCYNTRR